MVRCRLITCSVVRRRLFRARLSWRQERATGPMAFDGYADHDVSPSRGGLLPRRWRCNSAARVCRGDCTPCSIPFLSASGAPRRYLLRQQTTALLFSFCRYSVRRIPSLLLISFVFIFFLPKKAAEGTGVFGYSVCASEMVCSEGGTHVLREFRLLSMYICWENT